MLKILGNTESISRSKKGRVMVVGDSKNNIKLGSNMNNNNVIIDNKIENEKNRRKQNHQKRPSSKNSKV